ncbi:MAG: DUF1016 family protein [Bacteroidaceae bacterium]|nr:DUF1016 family protein [Bacteroidaceae bacterium]
MSKLVKIDGEYANWIKDLSLRFRKSQIKAAVRVNGELIQFYWELGRDIVEMKADERWTENFWKNLHEDLQTAIPNLQGLSITNLQYTRRFYILYKPFISGHPQLVGVQEKRNSTVEHPQVVGEVKQNGMLEPAFLGQLSGYVSCANHVLKRDGDSPTVGLLICKSKDDVIAQYALEGYNNPLGISEYELSKLYPKDFKSTLPSIEDIERELRN